jgi:cephalosporin hydroxylase
LPGGARGSDLHEQLNQRGQGSVKRIWKMTADQVSQTLYVTYADGTSESLPLYGLAAFRALSALWVKAGWATKYSYNFSWMGRPIIQLPEDLLMIQELVHRVRPSVIIETGVAHGGSSVFYASLFEIFGQGRVIAIDIEIRAHNRAALEAHPLKKRITLIEGSSTASEVVTEVRGLLRPDDRVMTVLDSNHTKAHVLRELELYAPLVTPGSYIVATDGNMVDLHDVPGGKPEWVTDNPQAAVHEFLSTNPEFEIDTEPTRLGITYWPNAYLRRK